ncbi:MAG: PD-(D/E)XK nuclease family transposase [Pirellula sp.]
MHGTRVDTQCSRLSGAFADGHRLKPVFAICLLEGILWQDSHRVHHTFRLVDQETNHVLKDTIEFHILEMGWYNLAKSELAAASPLERWLCWLLHAHEHTETELVRLFPESEFRQATRTLVAIQQITEDKQRTSKCTMQQKKLDATINGRSTQLSRKARSRVRSS